MLSVQCNNWTSAASNTALDHIVYLNTSTGVVNSARCAGGLSIVNPSPPPFNIADLDPLLIAGAVGAGFFCLIPLWVVIYSGKKLIDVIR